jgi:hypothetical protein
MHTGPHADNLIKQARNEALEEAMKIANQVANIQSNLIIGEAVRACARIIALAIEALKEK